MRLGIDFGTCFSSAAFFDGESRTFVKDSLSPDFSIPSSIFLSAQEQFLVGRIADNQRLRDPQRYRHEFKRGLGSSHPLLLGNRPYQVEDLVAEILGKIKRDADAQMSNAGRQPFSGAVLTIPATYQEHKRTLMLQAAVQAGFLKEGVTLLTEPVAAALYYAQQSQMNEGELLLVYDLGGGTFDTALLQKQGDDFKYLALPAGLEKCGGIDFDRAIYQDVLRQHPELQDLLQETREDRIALLARLMVGEKCREVKHHLSELLEDETSIVLPGTGDLIDYRLRREDFERMIAPTIEETIICSRNMLQSANISNEQISRILLVGGSCRIPYVQQRLQQEFHCPINAAPDLELVVCQGAALYAKHHKVYVVSATPGEAEYSSIGAAMQDVHSKSAILVRPGTYRETLVLDREVEIIGVGVREEIILTASDPISVKMATSNALLRGITIHSTGKGAMATSNALLRGSTIHSTGYGAVVVTQGHLALEDCAITAKACGISIFGSKARATLQNCLVQAEKNAGVDIGQGGQGRIEGCEITGEATGILIRDRSVATILHSRIYKGQGLMISGQGSATVEDCEISDNDVAGIRIYQEGSMAIIRRCRLNAGKKVGVKVWQKGKVQMEECEIFDNLHAGIFVSDEGSVADMRNCQIHYGRDMGIDIVQKGQLFLQECKIYGNVGAGIRISDEGSRALIRRCHIHDGAYTGIQISKNSQSDIEDCEIINNGGPGIRCVGSKASISGGVIRDGNGAGFVVEDQGEVTVKECTIEGNKLDVYVEPGSTINPQSLWKIERPILPQASNGASQKRQQSAQSQVSREVHNVVQLAKPMKQPSDTGSAAREPVSISSSNSNPSVQRIQTASPAENVARFRPEELTLVHTLKGHNDWVRSVAISSGTQTLVSGSEDTTIRVWDIQTGKLLNVLSGHTHEVMSVALSSHKGTLASAGCDNMIKLWNLKTGQPLHTFTGHSLTVYSLAMSADGQFLVSGGDDDFIKIWNLQTGLLLHTLTGHTGQVRTLFISHDGKMLASGSGDKSIKIWNLQTGLLLHTLTGHIGEVRSVVMSGSGEILASGGEDETILVWNVQTGQHLYTLTGHTRTVYTIAISPDGHFLISGSGDGTIKIWNIRTKKLQRTLTGNLNPVLSVAISPDGQTLASGGIDKTVRVWGKT